MSYFKAKIERINQKKIRKCIYFSHILLCTQILKFYQSLLKKESDTTMGSYFENEIQNQHLNYDKEGQKSY